MAWKIERVSVAGKAADVPVKYVGGAPVAVEWPEKPPRPAAVRLEGWPSFWAGVPQRIGDGFKIPLIRGIATACGRG